MKRLLAIFIALILMTPSLALAEPSKEKLPPQNVFNFTIVLQIQPAKIGNQTNWIGKFHVEVKLVDPEYRHYLDELAKNNSESANALFWTIINNTVYTSLRYNIIQKYQEAGLRPGFIVPKNGPITLGNNWNATVDLGVTDFLLLKGHYLVSPMEGNLTLWMANKTYAFNWNRLVVILPTGYEVHELSPKPAQIAGNIAIWNNGDYMPAISLYSPGYSFVKFLNETQNSRELKLRYTPVDGHLYFEAIFPNSNAPGVVKDLLLYTFKQALQPLSVDVINENGTLKVVGVAVPPSRKSESFTSITWQVYVQLPFPFSKVDVSGGSYKQVGPATLIVTVSERNTRNLVLYGGIGILVIVVLLAIILQKRKKKPGEVESSGTQPEETSGESEGEKSGTLETEDEIPPSEEVE
ncbi:hypothetical protein [Thermococcus sp.]